MIFQRVHHYVTILYRTRRRHGMPMRMRDGDIVVGFCRTGHDGMQMQRWNRIVKERGEWDDGQHRLPSAATMLPSGPCNENQTHVEADSFVSEMLRVIRAEAKR